MIFVDYFRISQETQAIGMSWGQNTVYLSVSDGDGSKISHGLLISRKPGKEKYISICGKSIKLIKKNKCFHLLIIVSCFLSPFIIYFFLSIISKNLECSHCSLIHWNKFQSHHQITEIKDFTKSCMLFYFLNVGDWCQFKL